MIDEQLRQAVHESELSLREMARQAGLTPASVIRFANGERDLRLAGAAKLAEVLGLELASTPSRKRPKQS